jgi:uncharacterized phage protein (TIGR02220 family)
MARIRTIKPEFWTSEQVADCSPNTRLLFIGMWSFCDDNGIHPASLKRIKMEVFPSDSISESELQTGIQELITSRLLSEYDVAGKRFWQVTGWHNHQRIDRPTFKFPLPKSSEAIEGTRTIAKQSPTIQREVAEQSTTEWKGKEVILSGKPNAAIILQYLNELSGRNYQAVKANLSLIESRIKEGFSLEQCKAVIDAKCKAWESDTKMSAYLRPKTLFNATNFAQYAGELESQTKEVQSWE